MKFSFELNKELSTALQKADQDIRKNGGKFNGNDKSGTFEGKGIKGNYSITGKTVNITIMQKPLLIKDDKIKSEILNYFGL
ncbi:hypothetical protein AGMMS49991_03260 [Spirochaetia bacterium]|nr:hypothetical protein AGMMS49991_03260 [Spirochaetia bacterium]